jgi:hypothetical protein
MTDPRYVPDWAIDSDLVNSNDYDNSDSQGDDTATDYSTYDGDD